MTSTEHLAENAGFDPEEWICADNLETIGGDIAWVSIHTQHPDSAEQLHEQLQMIGRYNTNGGLISFVSQDGSLYVSPESERKRGLLEQGGYVKGDIPVPFSGRDIRDHAWDPGVTMRLNKLRAKSRLENTPENTTNIQELIKGRIDALNLEGTKLRF